MLDALAPYRRVYAVLVRLYPKAYRTRYGEGMQQTFNDLLRERAIGGEAMLPFAIWAFTETAVGLAREYLSSITSFLMSRNILIIASITALLLLIPLVGMQVSDEWNWTLSDFVFAGVAIFGFGLAFELISRRGGTVAYRVATGLVLLMAFLLVWINAAVGFIGDDGFDGPNMLYLLVLAIGFFGGIATRFQARGMSWVLFAAAAMQMAVPFIALLSAPAAVYDDAPGLIGVFVLNAVFAMAFAAAGYLYRQSVLTRA